MKSRKNKICYLLPVLLILAVALGLSPVTEWVRREKGEREGIVIDIEDNSEYAGNPDYELYGYTRYIRDGELLLRAERYDGDGWQQEWMQWVYDEAGRTAEERFCDGPGREWETGKEKQYEYDEQGDLVHEWEYENGILNEESFYRPLEEGFAGVTYTYEVSGKEGNNPLWQIASYESYVCNTQGDVLYCLRYDKDGELTSSMRAYYDERGRLLGWKEGSREDARWRVYSADWQEEGGTVANTVTCFGRTVYAETYVRDPATDALLLTAHTPGSETGEDSGIYRAAYDKSQLLWEMSCLGERLDCFRSLCYDQAGALSHELACVAYDDGFDCVLRRYEYDSEGRLLGMYDYESRVVYGAMGMDGGNGYAVLAAETFGKWPLAILIYDPDGEVRERLSFDESGMFTEEKKAGGSMKEWEGEPKHGNDRNRSGNDKFTGGTLAGRPG